MNIKFLFEYLDSKEKSIDAEILEIGFNEDNDYHMGYLQAIQDFRGYLKQAIELTNTKSHGNSPKVQAALLESIEDLKKLSPEEFKKELEELNDFFDKD